MDSERIIAYHSDAAQKLADDYHVKKYDSENGVHAM